MKEDKSNGMKSMDANSNGTTEVQSEVGTDVQENNVVFDDSGANTEIVTVEVISTPHTTGTQRSTSHNRSLIWNENNGVSTSDDVPPLNSNSLSWKSNGVQSSNTENGHPPDVNGVQLSIKESTNDVAISSNINFASSYINGEDSDRSNFNNNESISSSSNSIASAESEISNGNTYICINSNIETVVNRGGSESKIYIQNGKVIIKSDDLQTLQEEVPSLIEIKGDDDVDLSKVKSELQPLYENVPEEGQPSHLRKRFHCDVCEKSFVSKKGYVNHMASHGDESHECNICKKCYKSEELLKNHVKCHEGTKKFQCEFCDKAYRQSTSLQQHYSVHSGEKSYFCDICGDTFNYLTNFIRHKKRHEGKTYKCEICDKTFVEQTSIYRHKKLHNGQKEHECDVCGKSFYRAGNLREHRKTHEPREKKEKIFQCEHCQKAYPYRSSLRKHYIKKHGQYLPELSNNVKWI